MIRIEQITPAIAMVLKDLRLRALSDTPLAFGSTYARESAFSDAEWIERAEKWSNGVTSIGYIAFDGDDQPCGIAAAYVEVDKPKRANLVSMWTSPTHRRRGVGRMLVEKIVAWAESRGFDALHLLVVGGNDSAARFYESLGFEKSGCTEPYPNDPALIEHEMIRRLRGT